MLLLLGFSLTYVFLKETKLVKREIEKEQFFAVNYCRQLCLMQQV